ncbi:MAG: hypothetical protein IKC69_06430, partial [Clostridia bacterium]|nr:hypothetical protein [Clostridia bacterium]
KRVPNLPKNFRVFSIRKTSQNREVFSCFLLGGKEEKIALKFFDPNFFSKKIRRDLKSTIQRKNLLSILEQIRKINLKFFDPNFFSKKFGGEWGETPQSPVKPLFQKKRPGM